MSTKDAYQQKLEAKLREWNAEIERMQAKAEQAEADARVRYQSEIRRLEEERARAEAKLEELRQSSDEAWDELKHGMENAWASLEDAMKRARDKFS